MATYADILRALPAFRNDVIQRQPLEARAVAGSYRSRRAFAAFSPPSANIHAMGAGIRQRGGRYFPKEFVLKLYVFDKVSAQETGETPEELDGIPIDVEELPVQRIRASRGRSGRKGTSSGAPAQRRRARPVIGGLSISPINAQFAGTLGCFLRRTRVEGEDLFVLSNNHVLADVDRLPRGTEIVQPGPEQKSVTPPADVFALLSATIPLRFPDHPEAPVFNRFDAAIALVTDLGKIKTGKMFGGGRYDPSRVLAPEPGMRVIKAGRTTGVTRGMVTATNVDGIQVNYGTQQNPRIAVFEDTVEIVATSDDGPFSLPGDSGAVILEEQTGHPVALLFAGDGVTTTACDLGALCRRFRAWPV